ncbi:MAG: hypothetical protein LUC26_05450 [Prevotella sp.]|nr:hypothetical protein [Prevotella sp.]
MQSRLKAKLLPQSKRDLKQNFFRKASKKGLKQDLKEAGRRVLARVPVFLLTHSNEGVKAAV